MFVKAWAAAKHISSVIVRARTSRVPRKMPGKPRELFTWFGKSERPVATTTAPASMASHGQISGIGLAQANRMASFAMPCTHSGRMVPGPGLLIPMVTSAPRHGISNITHTAFRIRTLAEPPLVDELVPAHLDILTVFAKDAFRIHHETIRWIHSPAKDQPRTSNIRSAASDESDRHILLAFANDFKRFISPASVTVAVPCWSSCQMGISAFSRSVSRMRKHFGCEISSRLTPPNPGWSIITVLMIASASFVSSISGTASTPPRYLYNKAFPSITGRPAFGPISPNPRHACRH